MVRSRFSIERERVNVSNNSISSTRCHLHIFHSLSNTVQAETKRKQAKLEINELCKQPSIESNQLIYVTGPNGVVSSHIDVLFNIRLNKKKKNNRETQRLMDQSPQRNDIFNVF